MENGIKNAKELKKQSSQWTGLRDKLAQVSSANQN